MSDDERLTALFRAAASDADAPPPGFGHDEVVATSRRITARRRTAAVAAAAVVGLVGLGAAIVLPQQDGGTLTSAAAAPVAAPEAGDSKREADSSSGGAGSGSAPPAPSPMVAPAVPQAAGDAAGCADRHDPGLRALVDQALPELAGAPDAMATDICLPPAQRYLSLQVDGDVLTVSYLPPGTVVDLAPGALSAPAASGGTVLVSTPAGLADRAPALLRYLAPRL